MNASFGMTLKRPEGEIDIAVSVWVTPAIPATIGGCVEHSNPGDPGDFEIISIKNDDTGAAIDVNSLTDEEYETIREAFTT